MFEILKSPHGIIGENTETFMKHESPKYVQNWPLLTAMDEDFGLSSLPEELTQRVAGFLSWKAWTSLRNTQRSLRRFFDHEFILPAKTSPSIDVELFHDAANNYVVPSVLRRFASDPQGSHIVGKPEKILLTSEKFTASLPYAICTTILARLRLKQDKQPEAEKLFRKVQRLPLLRLTRRIPNPPTHLRHLNAVLSFELGMIAYQSHFRPDVDEVTGYLRYVVDSPSLDQQKRKEAAAVLALLLRDQSVDSLLDTGSHRIRVIQALKLAASLGDAICQAELGMVLRTGQY